MSHKSTESNRDRASQVQPSNACSELLGCCLRGEQWAPGLLDRALAIREGREFLSVVVERLADTFEPDLCDIYARLFTDVIERVAPELLHHVRRRRAASLDLPSPESVTDVYVLSRVTLGADIAVTSVLMDAAKRRFPDATIHFTGPRKNYELFEADPRVAHFPAPYSRNGSVKDRLEASTALWIDEGLVIDPDSRLSQLGLIQVCPEGNYCWFESRSYGGDGNDRLPDLAARWARERFGIEDARPYIAPLPAEGPAAEITVSLGVGNNPAKRVDDEAERGLLRMLAATGCYVLVDKGADAEEAARVEAALAPGMRTHQGSFAPFAADIARSRLFVGYDSAAGHAASACGVPLISIAKGFVNARMAARWRPNGIVLDGGSADVLERVRLALHSLGIART